MQFFIDVTISLFTVYLAFTNQIADKILSLIPGSEAEIIQVADEKKDDNSLSYLPSIFNSNAFPDILLRSAEYQKAAAIEATSNNYVTTNPTEALVNLFCTFTTPTTIRTTTGTGFFVHSDGVIITNAHVAQFLLIGATEALGKSECIIRQGTPATAKFRAELLYIPPTWVQQNAAMIDDVAPTGTGERDYALLYVSETLDGSPLPAVLPALAIDSELLPRTIKGKEVSATGYPASDLIRNGPNTPLLSVSATTTISELYTFNSNYADVFSIHGSKVGAEGSSGGPIVNKEGKVIGMIVTRGDDSVDGQGSLRAITMSHIHRTILEETGFSLDKNITGNLAFRSSVFTKTLAPFLISLLSQELSN